MPNNDLISRASVLEALRELEKKMRIGGEYDSFCSGVVRATQLVECFQQVPAVTDPLSAELELSPIGMTIRKDYGCYTAEMFGARGIRFPVNGRTPLEAVLKLKEALNSKP